MTVLTTECVQEEGLGFAHSCSGKAIQPSQFLLPAKGTPKSTGTMLYLPIKEVGDQ